MTQFINPSTRHDGAKQIVVSKRIAPADVYEAPFDDGLYVRSNGDWVLQPQPSAKLSELDDVDTTGAVAGSSLRFDGTTWVDEPTKETAWAAASLVNSWANYGSGYGYSAAYRKLNSGLVIVRGLIKNGTPPSVAFTLPSGFRPAEPMRFVTRSSSGFARTDVSPNGAVTIVGFVSGGSSSDVALEGIIFYPSSSL